MKIRNFTLLMFFIAGLSTLPFVKNVGAAKNVQFKRCFYEHQDPGMTYPEDFHMTTVYASQPCPAAPNPDLTHSDITHDYSDPVGIDFYSGVTRGNEKCKITVIGVPMQDGGITIGL